MNEQTLKDKQTIIALSDMLGISEYDVIRAISIGIGEWILSEHSQDRFDNLCRLYEE